MEPLRFRFSSGSPSPSPVAPPGRIAGRRDAPVAAGWLAVVIRRSKNVRLGQKRRDVQKIRVIPCSSVVFLGVLVIGDFLGHSPAPVPGCLVTVPNVPGTVNGTVIFANSLTFNDNVALLRLFLARLAGINRPRPRPRLSSSPACPQLTAPIRGKPQLTAPNRTKTRQKIFGGASPYCFVPHFSV